MFRSGLVGFTLHGSLSHYYYQFCEVHTWLTLFISSYFLFTKASWSKHFYFSLLTEWILMSSQVLFPFHDWWVVPVKVAFDQTIWSAIWNSIYFSLLGVLRFESPASIFKELKATFFPMLTVRNLYVESLPSYILFNDKSSWFWVDQSWPHHNFGMPVLKI